MTAKFMYGIEEHKAGGKSYQLDLYANGKGFKVYENSKEYLYDNEESLLDEYPDLEFLFTDDDGEELEGMSPVSSRVYDV